MKAFRNGITRALNGLAGVSFLAMVILTCWQVLTRYVLKNPSTWSEELVGYLFAWMSLLGASIVTSERGHMNIPIVVERFSTNVQKGLNCLGEVIAFLFSAVILVFGHGADDLFPGCSDRHLLHSIATLRNIEYHLYNSQYY